MKIWSFTTVKDEEDIIESFVRYNMNIFDGMVISDNGSNDKTLDILKKLKKEGYNIDILVDNSQYFDQVVKRNDLLQHTIKKHHPDFAFPIDADEFVCTTKKTNPRKVIEKLGQDVLYRYRMKNYVVNGKEDENELFIPTKLKLLRDNEEDKNHSYKCIIPKNIYKQNIFLEMGSHKATFVDDDREMPMIYLEDLYIAHYPVRSKFQLINKVITGRLNHMSLHSRDEGFGFHQFEILDEIVKEGTISDDTLFQMSRDYSLLDKSTKYTIEERPINIKFCKKINIKYTIKGNDDKLLSNTLKTSIAIINHMREENKNEHMEYERYKNEFLKVINSKTWRYKEKIVGFFQRKKKNES